jgi:hypothetical protein
MDKRKKQKRLILILNWKELEEGILWGKKARIKDKAKPEAEKT